MHEQFAPITIEDCAYGRKYVAISLDLFLHSRLQLYHIGTVDNCCATISTFALGR